MKAQRSLLSLLLLLAACADELPSPTPDSGSSPRPDSGITDRTIVFEGERVEGPALLFGDAELDASRLAVELVAHQLEAVYGLAFRLEYDPEVLEYESIQRLPAFIHEALFEAKLARPGLLVVAASAVGPARGVYLDDASVARISFTRRTQALTELRVVRPSGLASDGETLWVAAGRGALVER